MTLSSVDLKNNGGATAVKRPMKNFDKLPQNGWPETVCTANSNNEEIKNKWAKVFSTYPTDNLSICYFIKFGM